MISFRHNIDEFQRSLSDVSRRQLPFATSLALNDAAEDVQSAWSVHVQRRLDRPRPFTVKGMYRRRATKSRLAAEVGFKDIQRAYLRLVAEGGTREPKRRALLVPVGTKLDRYGNMPRGAVQKMLRRADTFTGRVGRADGIFKRPGKRARNQGKGLLLLVAFEPRAQYRRQLDLVPLGAKVARAKFPSRFRTRFMQALRTAN